MVRAYIILWLSHLFNSLDCNALFVLSFSKCIFFVFGFSLLCITGYRCKVQRVLITNSQIMTTKTILTENSNNKFINLLSVTSRNGSSMEGTEIVLDNLDYTWQATTGHRIVNATIINNNSALVIDPVLIERFSRNRRIDAPWYHILIVLYSILIIFGALGNILVVMAVIRKPVMRTARNLFILNLAVSGMLSASIN